MNGASYISLPKDSAAALLVTLLIISFTLVLFLQFGKTGADRPIREVILIQLAIIIHLIGYTLYSCLGTIPQVLFWTKVNYTGTLLIALTGSLFSFRLKAAHPFVKKGFLIFILLLMGTVWLGGDHYFLSRLNPDKTHSSLVKGDLFPLLLLANVLICAYLVTRTIIYTLTDEKARMYLPLMLGLTGGFIIIGLYGVLSAMLSLVRTQSWLGMLFISASLTWFTQSYIKRDFQEKERLEKEMTRYLDDLIHDDLTGVYTRDYIMESLSHCISQLRRNFRLYTLVYIDLDGMKALNDEAGHDRGDEILKILGGVLLNETRESDIPARIGGDEFLLLMDDCPPEQALNGAEGIRDRFRTKSREALQEWGFDLQPTLSMGILCSRHWEGDETNIISKADEAMYTSKKNGKNRITVYSPDKET